MRSCKNAKYHVGDLVLLERKTPRTGRFVPLMNKFIGHHGIVKSVQPDANHIYYRVRFGGGDFEAWWCMEDWLDSVVTFHGSDELDAIFA